MLRTNQGVTFRSNVHEVTAMYRNKCQYYDTIYCHSQETQNQKLRAQYTYALPEMNIIKWVGFFSILR